MSKLIIGIFSTLIFSLCNTNGFLLSPMIARQTRLLSMNAGLEVVDRRTLTTLKLPKCVAGILQRVEEDPEYELSPQLVGTTSDRRCTEEFPSHSHGVFVKTKIVHLPINDNGKRLYSVYVTAIAAGSPRGVGASTANALFLNAVEQLGLDDLIDGSCNGCENYGATDVITLSADICLLSWEDGAPLGVFEIEADNRDVKAMRRDYRNYFRDSNVQFVAAMKVYASSCAAVVWTRDSEGSPMVSRALDMGIAPLSSSNKAGFEKPLNVTDAPLDVPALPAVTTLKWERLDPSSNDLSAYEGWYAQHGNKCTVTLPVVIINSSDSNPGFKIEKDLTVNLGRIYFDILKWKKIEMR